MKSLKFILAGILFGVIMSKSEAISWFRIQEMFRFQSFHMYGLMGTAVVLGALAVFLIKRFKSNDYKGDPITFQDKDKSFPRYILGGTLFGLGWALTGSCPGPMFVNIGQGYLGMVVVIFGALIGTYTYGLIKNSLPH
jgi:uncharacterized membrane protein YedE/YeeE